MIDFAPTILRAAGARLRNSIDGQPMLRVARRGDAHWRRGVLTETGPPNTVDYARLPSTLSARSVRPFSVGVRTKRYLYLRHLTDEVELYDMRRDLGQLTNVAHSSHYAGVRRWLAKPLHNLRHCAGRECRRPLLQ